MLYFVFRCSMALLHSRVRRVFYEAPNLLNGGLGSVYRIHTEEGLNHHFEVYKIIRALSKSDKREFADT